MQIEKNSVVEFTFSLVDDDDQLMEATQPQTTAILFGGGNVIVGIEEALAGRIAGDQFTVTVPPEQGYGMRRDDFTQRVSKKYCRSPSTETGAGDSSSDRAWQPPGDHRQSRQQDG